MDNGEYRPEYSGQYHIPPPAPPAPSADGRPDRAEKKRIRRLYNGVGAAMVIQYLLIYAIFFAMYIPMSAYITAEYTEDGYRIVGFAETLIMFLSPAAASVIMFFLYNAVKGIKPSSSFGTDGFDAPFVIRAVTATFLFHQAGMILAYALMAVIEANGYGTPSLEFELADDIPTLAADVFTSVILAPIAEEMFFRGIILKETAKVSGRFAIFFSALMFGLMHGNPYQAVMATLVGIALGYITIKAKSIIPAIICHMAMNTAASVCNIAGYIDEALEDPVFLIMSAAELAIGVMGFAYVLKTQRISLPPYTGYHKKRTLPIIFTSVFVIIAVALYIFDIITSVEPIENAEGFAETAARIFILFKR